MNLILQTGTLNFTKYETANSGDIFSYTIIIIIHFIISNVMNLNINKKSRWYVILKSSIIRKIE